MAVREKLGLVEFDVIWTQIKQRGMCLNIPTSQALEPKLEDCGGQHPRSVLCRSTLIWQYLARLPWVVLHPIVTFIGLSSASTHPNKLIVLSSRLLTGNPLVDAQVQTIKTIPKKVRHGLKSASLLSKITDSRTCTSSVPVKLCVARAGIRVDLRRAGHQPAGGQSDVQRVDTASMSRVYI